MASNGSGKKALIIRHGAYGDALMCSCAFPYLKADGYDITFYGNPRAEEVLRYNPHISEWKMYEDGFIPIRDLGEHYDEVSKDYDKTVIYTGAIEDKYLFSPDRPEYYLPLENRRKIVNRKNYYDIHVELAGYKPDRPNAEVYFNLTEIAQGRRWRQRRKDKFVITWVLAGSSINKQYRYFEPIARTILQVQDDILIYTVGDVATKLLTFEHPRVKNLVADLPFREVMLLIRYSDLVIGPETGLIVAAGCFDIPKIVFMSHACKEQLTEHWVNAYPIAPPCECSPCHLLHKYTKLWKDVCELSDLGFPGCTEHDPEIVMNTIEDIYRRKEQCLITMAT